MGRRHFLRNQNGRENGGTEKLVLSEDAARYKDAAEAEANYYAANETLDMVA